MTTSVRSLAGFGSRSPRLFELPLQSFIILAESIEFELRRIRRGNRRHRPDAYGFEFGDHRSVRFETGNRARPLEIALKPNQSAAHDRQARDKPHHPAERPTRPKTRAMRLCLRIHG